MDNNDQQKLIYPSVILGVCLVIAAGIASYAFYQSRQVGDSLTVTGSTKQKIVSDSVKWRSGFTRNVPVNNLKGGYAQMKNDQTAVMKFFKDNGINETQVDISPVFVDKPFQYDRNVPQEYILRQDVLLQSDQVDKINALSKNIQKLIDSGVIFSSQGLEYYYTKLPDLRISLLGDAVKDAKARADKLMENSGSSVGALKTVTTGVVQVLPVNSVEVSDYGAYDTSTIEKEAMVTVKATFAIK
jgi:hypothetical protein